MNKHFHQNSLGQPEVGGGGGGCRIHIDLCIMPVIHGIGILLPDHSGLF